MAILEIKSDALRVGIDTRGAELAYITGADGVEYLWRGEPIWPDRSPLLFPICGGLKEDTYSYCGRCYQLPKHGFAQMSEFVGRKTGDGTAEFVLTDSDETRAVYPFAFSLTVRYALSGDCLRVEYEVENRSKTPMFFSIGAHEGYACPEGIEAYDVVFDEAVTLDHTVLHGNLLADERVRMLENGRVFPLREEYFAVDALVFCHIPFRAATLVQRGGGKRVRVEFPDADYFLLWTKPHAGYICLEPWLGIPDREGTEYDITRKEGIRRLEIGARYTTVHTVTCRYESETHE